MVTIILGIVWTLLMIGYESLKLSGVWDDGFRMTIKHPVTKQYVEIIFLTYGETILFGLLVIIGIIYAVLGWN